MRVRFNREINSIINSLEHCFINEHVTLKPYVDWSHDVVPSVRFAQDVELTHILTGAVVDKCRLLFVLH